jgi:phospholipid/cholesterol/gamma-HCH transport system permease protein
MKFLFHVGRYFSLLKMTFARPEKHRMYIKQLFYEIENLGVSSVGIVVMVPYLSGEL